MNVLAWIVFIGCMVEAGGILFGWVYSFWQPLAANDIFPHQDYHLLRDFSLPQFSVAVFLTAAVMLFAGYTAYLVILVLSRIKLSNPFTMDIALRLERISYFLVATWVVAMLKDIHSHWLEDRVPGLKVATFSGDFIITAGIVFVFAQIFKKGVELQTENELTV